MIFAYVGKTGNGKSAYASSLIRKSIASGIKVYTNIHVKETSPLFRYFKDFSVLTDVTEGEIICDEAQTYLNSRDWAKLPQSFQLLLQQHRHRGLNFHGFTQSIKRMDTVFRELVQEFYSLHKIFVFFSYGLFFKIKLNDENMESLKTIGFPDLFFADKEVFDYYDTHALGFEGLENLGSCPDCGQMHFLNPTTEEQRSARDQRKDEEKRLYLSSISQQNFNNAIHHELIATRFDEEIVLPISKKTVVPVIYV